MTLRCVERGGEWPPGIYWSPGEARTLPEGYPVPDEAPPAWLVELGGEVAPTEPAPGEG